MVMMMMSPVLVDESVEGHPVPPAGAEVVDVDVLIPGTEEEVAQHQSTIKKKTKHTNNHFRPKEVLGLMGNVVCL